MMRVFLVLSFLLAFLFSEEANATDILAERAVITQLCAEFAGEGDDKEFWDVRLSEVPPAYLSKIKKVYRGIRKSASKEPAMLEKTCKRERIGYDLAVLATRYGEDLEIFRDKLTKEDLSSLDEFEAEMTATFKAIQALTGSDWLPESYFAIYHQFVLNSAENIYLQKEGSVSDIADFILNHNKALLDNLKGQLARFEKLKSDEASVNALLKLDKKAYLTCKWAGLLTAHSLYGNPKWGNFEAASEVLNVYVLEEAIVDFYEELGGKGGGISVPRIVRAVESGSALPRKLEQQRTKVFDDCGEAKLRNAHMVEVFNALYPSRPEAP